MGGLILRDIIGCKRTLQLFFLILLGGVAISPFVDVGGYLMLYATMIGVMVPVQAMTDDEKNHWNQCVVALPFARNRIAICKYILSFVCIGLSYFGLSIGCLLSESMQAGLPDEMIWGCMGLSVLYTIIVIPLTFQFGTAKSRILILAVFYIPMLLIFVTTQLGVSIDYLGLLERYVSIIPMIYAILIAISIGISIYICNRKEF